MTGGISEMWFGGDASGDEVAAVTAAILQILLEEGSLTAAATISRWTRVGRFEAQGLQPDERALRRGWTST